MSNTVLVLGATGKTGRRLVPRLLDAGATVRAASRHPDETGTLFDWDRPETHAAALAGADAVYLIGPELVEDPTPVTGPFLEQAAEAGVGRVVYLSALNVADTDAPPSGYRKVEQQVAAAGVEWTILRPTAFSQNFSEGFLLPGILHMDAVVASTGDGAVPFVDADDIAAMAAAALLEDGHAKAEYALTGPEPLTHAQAAELVTAAAGRSIVHRDISSDEMRQILLGNGLPDDYASMVLGTMDAIRDGRAAVTTDDVERVTGRPATSFADYVDGAAAAWARP